MTTNDAQDAPETTDAPEGQDAPETTAPEEGLTAEQLRAELQKVRKEAASRRVLTREQEKQLAEFETWKKSQMTESERLKAERDEAVKKLQDAETEKLQRKVARAAKLPVDLADRIRGNTEEEMLEDAKAMAKRLGGTANGMFAGQRGTPVGTGAARSEDAWFRELFNNAK